MIQRLDHVQLAYPPGRDDDARAFYGDLLGCVEVEKPAPMRARGGMWFQAGGIGLHLGVEPDFRPSVKAHVAFVVDDLDALVARLTAAGHEWTPTSELPGVRRGHTRDPFGNRLELIEQSPSITSTR
jgi:catechol 2,3-dioxygenase-like lactoylglutathione lyase family enzyme